MYKGNKIIIIIPALNEEGKIGNTVRKAKEKCERVDEILVINDGSTDKTKEEAEKYGAHVISFETNKGLGSAFKTAFKYAQEKNYDICPNFLTYI